VEYGRSPQQFAYLVVPVPDEPLVEPVGPLVPDAPEPADPPVEPVAPDDKPPLLPAEPEVPDEPLLPVPLLPDEPDPEPDMPLLPLLPLVALEPWSEPAVRRSQPVTATAPNKVNAKIAFEVFENCFIFFHSFQ
jgi:hypothetical protein